MSNTDNINSIIEILEREAPEPINDSFIDEHAQEKEKLDQNLKSGLAKLKKLANLTEDEVKAIARLD